MILPVALTCRTSDRTLGGGRGVEALAEVLERRLKTPMRRIGTPSPPRTARFEDDLRDARGCLLEAGGQVEDALAAGAFPLLLAAECSVAATTISAVLRQHPTARVLWLDAHGDFNTPETSGSAYLGGMGLSAACGRWQTGLLPDDAPVLDPARVILCGVRDLDAPERVGLELAGVPGVARPSEVADLVRDAPLYVHLDVDVLDPSVVPAQFPVAHGLSRAGLRSLLAEVARATTVVGTEVASLEAPGDRAEARRLAELVADAIEPLLAQGSGGS